MPRFLPSPGMRLVWLLLLGVACCGAQLVPNSTQLRIKSVNLNGNLGFTLAEFSMRFNESLYFQPPAPCPAGRCPLTRQQAHLDANPCDYMPCDFTLKGAECGKARLPQCEPLCAAQREAFCPPVQDWITLTLGEESDPIYMSNRISDFSLRVNFDQVCHALVFQVYIITGSGPVLPYHVDTIEPNIDHNCGGVNPPEGINAVCPAYLQCYRYGTYFMKMRNFEPNSIVTVKVSALAIESGPQKTQPLPDAPPQVIPDPDFPYHVPLQWSVPHVYEFAPTGTSVPFVVSSYYCGFVTLQVNMEFYNNTVLKYESYIVFVSTDAANPFPSSTTSDMLFLAIPFAKIYVCQTDPALPPARLFILLVRSQGSAYGLPGTITVTADYDRPELIPPYPPQSAGSLTWSRNTPWPASNWYSFGEGALQIECPGFSRFDCTAGCEKFGCCQDTWPAYPTGPSLQPLYPVPYPLRFLNQDIIFNDFAYFPDFLDSRTLGVTLVLEQNFGGSVQYGPLGPQWESVLPLCTLSRAESALGTLDGRWISGTHVPARVEREVCDYSQFLNISGKMDYLFSLFVQDAPDNVGTVRPLSLRYRADILTALDPWAACQAYVEDRLLVAGTLNLTSNQTKECPVYEALDPCCNPELAWNACCRPRDIQFQISFPSNASGEFGECPLNSCAAPVLDAYVQSRLTDTLGLCEPGDLTSPSQITTQSILAFSSCLTAHFGDDFEGVACFEDADCPQGPCDLIARRCRGNVTALSYAFLQCLTSRISTPSRISLIEHQGWTEAVKTQDLAQLLQEAYTAPYCVHAYHPVMGTLYRPYFQTFTGFPGCPYGNFRSLTNSITPTPWQSARQVTGGNCAYDFSSVTPNVDAAACARAEAYTREALCGVCETPASCLSVAPALCNQTSGACLLANGTLVTGLSEAACAQWETCTNGSYGDKSSCEATGVCQDSEQVYYFIDNTLWAKNHSRQGVCAFPMPPYDDPDCNVLYPGSFPTSYGCIRMGECLAVGFVLQCTVGFDSAASCLAGGGEWYPRPVTRAQCEDPTLCDVPRYAGLRTATWESTFQYLSRFPSAQDCADCDGQVRPVNKWRANRWLGGVMRELRWYPEASVSPYGMQASLDFLSLSRVNIEAAESSTAYQNLNALQCSYGSPKTYVQTLACDCLLGEGREACFSQNERVSLGRGRFCPQSEDTIVAPPFALTSDNSTLGPEIVDQCVTFEIIKIPYQVFNPPPSVPVTISFKSRQAPGGPYAVVYNSQGARVGSALGDGLRIRFDSSRLARSVGHLSVCQLLPPGVPRPAQYPVLDFGAVDTSASPIQVRPLHLEVGVLPGGQVCALIPTEGRAALVVVPIARVAQDEEETGTLTGSERACLYAVASLFAGAAGVWVALMARVVIKGAFRWTNPSNVVWGCAIWIFVQRGVYLYLVAAGVLNQPDAHQLADYFMMDFPMCVYLVAIYHLSLSFLFLCYLKPEGDPPKFWAAFGAGSFLIVMLFIGVLIAYQYEVVTQQGFTGPLLCPVYNDAAQTSRTIRLVYQSIILFASLAIGAGELGLGLTLHRQIADFAGDKIFFLCVTAGAGILSDSVAFLVYYIVNEPTPYFSIVLIFTEILPLLALAVQLSRFAVEAQTHSLSSHSSSPGASGSHRHTSNPLSLPTAPMSIE